MRFGQIAPLPHRCQSRQFLAKLRVLREGGAELPANIQALAIGLPRRDQIA